MKRIRKAMISATALSGILLAGCGAAYYGTALGIIATQDEDETDLSFPDAQPTTPIVPGFATLQLGTTPITVSRTDASNNVISVTDFPINSIDFPPGFGTAESNRDTGTTILDGDRLVVRIHNDTSQAITFVTADVSTTGDAVAAVLQAKIRALTPVDTVNVPTEAYSQFTATYSANTGSYTFTCGVPSETSAVVWQPAQTLAGDAAIDTLSTTTASRLGLGVDNGGIEVEGGESLALILLNRGTDIAASGISLYLSKDKVLSSDDLFFDTMTGSSIAVGNARRYFRRNGAPASTLVRFDIADVALDGSGNAVDTPRSSAWYVLFDVGSSGGESALDNNFVTSRKPIEVYQPLDEPLTAGVTEVADPLDFAISSTSTPIGFVTGDSLNASLTLTNLGAAVGTSTTIPVDMILSSNTELDEPAAFLDPAGLQAGVRINPTDPNRAITIVLDNTGTAALDITISGNTLTAIWDPATSPTITNLVNTLNTDPDSTGLVIASDDGVGTPATDFLDPLFAALGTATTVVAEDIYLGTQNVSYPVTTEGTKVPVTVSATVPDTLFATNVLPLKMFPIFRIRPPAPVADPDNPRNNVRQAANFMRVYERSTAFFDPDGGLFLPTENDSDFAALDAVTTRPVNVDSIQQGQQRVFRFQIPDTGATVNESQVLILLTTDTFDPHMDLLSSSGELLAQSDDSALGNSPVLYTSLQANGTNRNFYLVVSSARFDESDLSGSETFSLTVSVNTKEPTDISLVAAAGGDDENVFTNQRYETADPTVENNVLIPFSLSKAKAEVAFYLPSRARVRVVSRPAFGVSVNTVFSQFTPGQVASVNTQPVLGSGFDSIVYRPSGGSVESFHILDAGAYVLAFESVGGLTDDQNFRLEVEAQYISD